MVTLFHIPGTIGTKVKTSVFAAPSGVSMVPVPGVVDGHVSDLSTLFDYHDFVFVLDSSFVFQTVLPFF